MKTMDQKEFARENVFGLGAENTAYAKYFIGQSYLNPLTRPESGLFLANVTFESGCRNNWHIHHAKKGGGQMLICTAGESYDFTGKTLVPFATSGGSGMGRTVDELRKLCPNADWKAGKTMNGVSDKALADWANAL